MLIQHDNFNDLTPEGDRTITARHFNLHMVTEQVQATRCECQVRVSFIVIKFKELQIRHA